MEDKKSEIIQICGLWQNETKDGAKYLKGNSGAVQYLVFRNKNKTAENQPDYHLCITKNQGKKESKIKSESNNPWNADSAENYQPENSSDYQEYNDDDTPF